MCVCEASGVRVTCENLESSVIIVAEVLIHRYSYSLYTLILVTVYKGGEIKEPNYVGG